MADCFRILRYMNWIEFGSSGSSKYKQHTRASNENEKKTFEKPCKAIKAISSDICCYKVI